MAADLSINITAKDEASQSLQNTKKGLDDVGKAAKDAAKDVKDTAKSMDSVQQSTNKANSYLEAAKQRFEKITESTKPAKQQLKELQNIMANLNLKGLSNTSEFTQIAQEAGRIKDAMTDAATAVRAYSADNLNLQAAAQGFQAVTAAGTIATGVMGLFGTENEKVHELLLKVQSAQAILNGVNTIANALNKDSVLVLKLKQIALAAKTTTETADTVATGANTVAQNLNTGSMKKATAAQIAYNTAKAIGKAMFGDFTGLLLLGIGAITTYAMVTSSAAEAEQERNKALEDGKRIAQERSDGETKMAESVANSSAKQIAAYIDLQHKWEECGNDVNKQKEFMSKYSNQIRSTGFSVNNLTDCENLFVKKTSAVVAAINQRARAQAAYELMVEKIKEGLKKINQQSIQAGTHYQNAAWGNLTDEEKAYLKEYHQINYNTDEEHRVSQNGLAMINRQREEAARERNKQWKEDAKKEMDANIQYYYDEYVKATEEANRIVSSNNLHVIEPSGGGGHNTGGGHGTGGGHNTGGNTTNTNTNTNKDTYLEDKAQLEEKFNKGIITEVQYKNDLVGIEKKHLDCLVKEKKLTEADIERYKNAMIEAQQLEIKTKHQDELNAALQMYNDGVLTEIEYAEKCANIQKTIYEDNVKLGTSTDVLVQNYKKAVQHVKELKGETSKYHQITEEIEKLQKQLLNDDSLTFEAKVQLAIKISELQQQLDNITNLNQISIKVPVTPAVITKGSVDDKRSSYDNANQRATRIQQDYEIGIIGYKEAKQQLQLLNEELTKLGLKPIKLELQTNFEKQFEKVKEGWGSISSMTNSIDGVVSAFERLKQAQDEGNNAWETLINIIGIVDSVFNAFGATIETIKTIQEVLGATTQATAAIQAAATTQSTANAAQEAANSATVTASKSGEAIAGAAASGAKMPFPYNLIAIAAGVAAVIAALASIKKFAGGGIIKGNTSLGDLNLARVNNGEMILNNRQQSTLFKMINDGKVQQTQSLAGKVVFEINGSNLKGVLRNYDNKMNKIT